MAPDRPAPPDVDTSTPNVARMWDYYLGGKDNFAADREAADRVLAMVPELRIAARAHREFLTRVVQRLTRLGIRQFIDIGSGLPTQGNVHEIAQEIDPTSRVVYVDYDPVVCAHGRALLETAHNVAVVQADLRHPDDILDNTDVRSLIDWDQPVAVLLVAIVHFLTDDDDPGAIIGRFRDAMAPGSYLALTHGSAESMADRERGVETLKNVYSRSTAPIIGRSREQISRLFDGFELIDPGLVWLIEWGVAEPVEQPERSLTYAGVGRKP